MMVSSIEDLLRKVKLDEYIYNFETNDINDLSFVNDETLKNIGIDKVGHRKRILDCIVQEKKANLMISLDTSASSNDDIDEPPPLPPKHSKTVPVKPKPIARSRASIKTVPLKSPDAVTSPVQLGDNYSMLFNENEVKASSAKNPPPPPAIPPRSDLGEKEIQETVTSPMKEKPKRPVPPVRRPTYKTKSPAASPRQISPTEKQSWINHQCEDSNSFSSFEDLSVPKSNSEENFNQIDIVKDSETIHRSGKRRLSRHVSGARLSTFFQGDDFESTNNTYMGDDLQNDVGLTLIKLPGNITNTNQFDIPKDSTKTNNYTKQSSLKSERGAQSEDDLSDEETPRFIDQDDENAFTNVLSLSRNGDEFMKYLTSSQETSQRLQNLNRKSKYFDTGKEGYLEKRGGQKGEKKEKRRWVSFNGHQLIYCKEKGSDPLQTIPLCRMKEVEIDPTAKKPTFHLLTPNRRFTFMDAKLDEITLWASVLTEAILAKDQAEMEASGYGKEMANPDKEGYLKKQGHTKLTTWNDRYVAIKKDKLCYYYNFQDFKDNIFIHSLEMSLVSLKEDSERLRLLLTTNNERTYTFEAEDESSFFSWKAAIDQSIQYGLGDDKFLNEIQQNPSNKICADCKARNPIYASINLMVVVCSECIGCHRFIGVSYSKTKSLLMDVKVWTPSLIKLFIEIGNLKANQLWSRKLPPDDEITPHSSREARKSFIVGKYKEKMYFDWSEHFGSPDDLGMALRANVVTNNILQTLKLLVSNADVYYIPPDVEDAKTPYELAEEAGQEMQMELLRQYKGHFTQEEREEYERKQKEFESLPKIPESLPVEKSGVILYKTSPNDRWKDRMLLLQGRRLTFKSASSTPRPEETDTIDLCKVEELDFNQDNQGMITIKLPKYTYILKAYLPDEAISWYNAIRNKQVMGVSLEFQDVNTKNVPFLIQKCIAFIEQHALSYEGIYRKSGGQTTVKRLILAFNQDAASVRLNIDDCTDVHAVASLLKQYLRELPEPLLTAGLYTAFTSNSYDEDHYRKMERYKNLIESLPPVNYSALRSLVIHLYIVSQLSEINKMNQDNIMLLFGPIFLSSGKTLDQNELNYEYAVVSDLLQYHEWLFEVTTTEKNEVEAMIKAIQTMHVLQSTKVQTTDTSLQITVYVEIPGSYQVTEDQCKMDDNTLPGDVCMFFIKKHNLSKDGNWALFEVVNDASGRPIYERPVQEKELVKQLAISLGATGKLVVKTNYVAEKLAPFQSTNLGVIGLLHFSKGNDKWKKNCFVEVRNGNIRVYAKKGATKEEDNIAIHETLLYLWIDSDLKKNKAPPGKHCFVLKKKDNETRYFSWDHEMEFNSYVGAILNVRYPTGIWTTISNTNNECNEILDRSLSFVSERSDSTVSLNSPHWGRQSTYLRARESSQKLMHQLQQKRQTLKHHLFNR